MLVAFCLTVLSTIYLFPLAFTRNSKGRSHSIFHTWLGSLFSSAKYQSSLPTSSGFHTTGEYNAASFLPLYNKDCLSSTSNNIFLLSFWVLTRSDFHISANILFMTIHVFSKTTESFSTMFTSSWAPTRRVSNVHVSTNNFFKASWAFSILLLKIPAASAHYPIPQLLAHL